MSTKLGKSNPCRVVPLQGGTKWGFWGADNVLKLNWGRDYMKIFALFKKKIIEFHAYNFGHFSVYIIYNKS